LLLSSTHSQGDQIKEDEIGREAWVKVGGNIRMEQKAKVWSGLDSLKKCPVTVSCENCIENTGTTEGTQFLLLAS
jgi:hypothetical protein